MSKRSGEVSNSKDVIQQSEINAGNNVHLGDVNITIQPEARKKSYVPLLLLCFLLGAVGAGLYWRKPGSGIMHPTNEQGASTPMGITLPGAPLTQSPKNTRPDKAGTSDANSGLKTLINNQLGGRAMLDGIGVQGIQIAAITGEITFTDKNGQFNLVLRKQEQVQHVRLFISDPEDRYEVILPVLDTPVPNEDMPVNLKKKEITN